jgi:rhodanese-related sulfurtransferase
MKLALRLLPVAIAIIVFPAVTNAQCTGTCAGTCLKNAAETFIKSVPDNQMYLMSVEKLAEMVDAGKDDYVLIDVRPLKHYENGHIEGSVNIPLPLLVEKLDSAPKNKKIAVVCSLDTNSAFAVAVLRMYERDAWIVEGGVYAWEGLGRSFVK